MSKSQLRKALAKMTSEDITEMVCELYDVRPEAKEYLEFWLNPDAKSELEKYKGKVRKLFFTSAGKSRKRPTVTSIKKTLKYFSSICYDSELVADLYLYVCDTDLEWLSTRRNPLVSVGSVKSNIETARQFVEAAGLEQLYLLRLERMEDRLVEIGENSSSCRRASKWRWRWDR